METRYPIEQSFGSEFPAICNHCVIMAAGSRKMLKFWGKFLHLSLKNDPYGKIVKIMFQKSSLQHRSTLLCSNFVKFGRREIGEIVCYLPDKKINFACLSNCC